MSTKKVPVPQHCRGCVHKWNPKNFRIWCCKVGRDCSKAIGECRLKNLKELKQ